MNGTDGAPARLLNPGSTAAVILGAHDWTGVGLERAPSFRRSAKRIVRHLYDPAGLGLDPELVLDLFDSTTSADDQLAELQQTLSQHVRERRETGQPLTDILLYYIGHGHPDDAGQLSLLVRHSRKNLEVETGIKTADLARTLRTAAPQQRRSVIFDCCFSERAAKAFIGMSSAVSDQVASVTANELSAGQAARGTLVLCSSGVGLPSIGKPDAEHTLFTGAVLEVLQQGVEGYPTHLSFADLRDAAFDRMLAMFGPTAPRPVLHQANASQGDLTRTPAFPNYKTVRPSERVAAEKRRPKEVNRPIERRQKEARQPEVALGGTVKVHKAPRQQSKRRPLFDRLEESSEDKRRQEEARGAVEAERHDAVKVHKAPGQPKRRPWYDRLEESPEVKRRREEARAAVAAKHQQPKEESRLQEAGNIAKENLEKVSKLSQYSVITQSLFVISFGVFPILIIAIVYIIRNGL